MSRVIAVVAACGWLTALSLAQPCGVYWSDQFSFDGLDRAVRALVVFDPDGDGPEPPAIYAGGEFVSYSGEQWLNYIARWTGTGWAPVGDGFDGPVYALTVFDDDGPGPNLPALYAGGRFTHADGAPANSIAKWEGNTWSPVGDGMAAQYSPTVYALAEFDDDDAGPNLPALYAGGYFTTAGGITANNVAKWDGTAWSALESGTNRSVYALAVFDPDGSGPQPSVLVAGGAFWQVADLPANRVAQWTGSTWSSLGAGANDYVDALAVYDMDGDGPALPVLVAGGWFTFAGGSSANHVARWNGASWAAFGSGTNDIVQALAAYDPDAGGPLNPLLVAGGLFTTAGGTDASRVAQWNGSSWSALASGADDTVYALAAFDSDGPGPGTPVLLAAGSYTTMGGMPADRVAAWDGATWQPFGSYSSNGTNNGILSLATFDDDGSGPHSPALYVGGSFTRVGDTQANYIAKWDGLEWSSLSSGVGDSQFGWGVYALCSYDPDDGGPAPAKLIAGGDFSTAGGISAYGIAQWNGASWSALGAGVDGMVAAVTSFDSDGPGPALPVLVAAGYFHTAGGVSAKHIAKWNGSSWSALGTGFDDVLVIPEVLAVAVYDSDGDGPLPPQLYAGGFFSSAGGAPVHGIAKWDGSTWSEVGGGLGGSAWSAAFAFAAFDDDGDGPNLPALYVGGGYFSTAGGVPAENIAKWDGTNWSALGEGLNFEVWDLAVFDDDGPGPRPPALYAAGYFTMSGNTLINHLARWNGTSWESVGGSTNGDLEALAVFDDDDAGPHLPALFAGGLFTSAGNHASANIAAWVPSGVPTGDMNCDGFVDFADINPFVLYLSNLATWRATFPDCPTIVGDINCDGTYGQASFGDINPFVALLTSP